jgi:glycine/D-amino acid oxidase-like deaminating enzyme
MLPTFSFSPQAMTSCYVGKPEQADAAAASSSSSPPLVIIGSGPCGLGAAYRLQELGHENFIVLEAGPEAGGLSITATDEQGFLWDMGTFIIGFQVPYWLVLSPTISINPLPPVAAFIRHLYDRRPRHLLALPVFR